MHVVKRDHPDDAAEKTEDQFRFFCKLFDDMISNEVCFLRRTHFNEQYMFSCRGCSKDTMLNSPRNRARRPAKGS